MRTLTGGARIGWLVLALVASSGGGWASTMCSVVGTVTDVYKGEPMPGVGVYLSDRNGYWSWSTTTDENGHYKFEGLSPGKYVVSLMMMGMCFTGADPQEVELSNGGTATVNFDLTPLVPDVSATVLTPGDGDEIGGCLPVLVRLKENWPCYTIAKFRLTGRAVNSAPGYVIMQSDAWWTESYRPFIREVQNGRTREVDINVGYIYTGGFRNGPIRIEPCIEYYERYGQRKWNCPLWDPAWGPCAGVWCDGQTPGGGGGDPGGGGGGGDPGGGGGGGGDGGTQPVVKNLTIENVNPAPENPDYVVYKPDGTDQQRDPKIHFRLDDRAPKQNETPTYSWRIWLWDTAGPFDEAHRYQVTGQVSGAPPHNVEATLIADPQNPLLPAASTYTYEIYACRGTLPDPNQPDPGWPGMGDFDEYWFRAACRLELSGTLPGTQEPGHKVWMEEDEDGNLTVKASWYLHDTGHKDASFFQIDLLRPDLSLATTLSDSVLLRTDVEQRERVIGTVTRAQRQQYPGVWRAIFRAVDDHGVDGLARYRRNSENKRMYALNTRFRVQP